MGASSPPHPPILPASVDILLPILRPRGPMPLGPTESDSVTEQLLLVFVRMSGRFATQPPHRLRPAFFDNVGRAFVEWEWGLVGTLLIACGFAEKKEGHSKDGENLSNYTTHSWRLVSLATLNSARCCLTHLSSRVTFLPRSSLSLLSLFPLSPFSPPSLPLSNLFFISQKYGHKIVVSKQTADTLLWAVPTFFTTAGLLSNDVGLWYAIRFYYYFI